MKDAPLVPESSSVFPFDIDLLSGLPRQISLELCHESGSFKTMEELRREIIRTVIEACGGNMSEAARVLDIGRSTLYRIIEEPN